MRYNSLALEKLGSNPLTKFDKEGSLYLTEKQESLFKTTEVHTLLIFKLRGNLLFYYKPRQSIPIGLYVLENCFPLILNEDAERDGYAFFIEYHQDNYPSRIRFTAPSAQERREWFDKIKQSSHIYLDRQIKYLKQQIVEKMGNRIECGVAANENTLLYGISGGGGGGGSVVENATTNIEFEPQTTAPAAAAAAAAAANYISKEGDLIQF